MAVETVTNTALNKLGWLHMCKASHIFFVDTTNQVIHCVRLNELKELVKHGTFKVVYTHQRVQRLQQQSFLQPLDGLLQEQQHLKVELLII